MATFWTELKRRNVVRVAIAYAIAAWLLIEVSATTFPMLRMPDWTATFVTVLVLLGFPLALILAWALELSPEGIKLEKDIVRPESITHLTGRKLDFIIIGVLAVALVYLGVDKFVLDRQPAQESQSAANSPKSIAVLPFVNMSAEQSNEYFSDGLSEELLNLLAKTPGLRVAARTSSFAFKGKNKDIKEIAGTLNVEALLEGSVRRDAMKSG
jgi:hypothetical protein